MNVLITGGAASGKSAYAEQCACALASQRIYVATMSPRGEEAKARIERHRQQRREFDFATVECCDGTLSPLLGHESHAAEEVIKNHCAHRVGPTSAYSDSSGLPKVVLLEDLGNLVANALFLPDGTMADVEDMLDRLEQEVRELARDVAHVVAVGNEVGSEGLSAYATTRCWVRAMGTLSCRLAAWFDTVIEVCAGVPIVLKGERP